MYRLSQLRRYGGAQSNTQYGGAKEPKREREKPMGNLLSIPLLTSTSPREADGKNASSEKKASPATCSTLSPTSKTYSGTYSTSTSTNSSTTRTGAIQHGASTSRITSSDRKPEDYSSSSASASSSHPSVTRNLSYQEAVKKSVNLPSLNSDDDFDEQDEDLETNYEFGPSGQKRPHQSSGPRRSDSGYDSIPGMCNSSGLIYIEWDSVL